MSHHHVFQNHQEKIHPKLYNSKTSFRYRLQSQNHYILCEIQHQYCKRHQQKDHLNYQLQLLFPDCKSIQNIYHGLHPQDHYHLHQNNYAQTHYSYRNQSKKMKTYFLLPYSHYYYLWNSK